MKIKKGDLVKSDYREEEKNIIRKITEIHKDNSCGSGYRASADAGKICKRCKRPFGRPIIGADADWFVKITERKENETR